MHDDPRPRGRLAALLTYAIAMGWLEAVVAAYIRNLIGFGRGAPMPAEAQMAQILRTTPWLLITEQSREAATLLMIVAVAWLGGATLLGRFGAFLLIFGVWDLVYYVGLFIMVGWPTSLGAIDLLFLIPPSPWWYQPVWVPVSIALVMTAVGVMIVRARR
jgi:hypothetical protein